MTTTYKFPVQRSRRRDQPRRVPPRPSLHRHRLRGQSQSEFILPNKLFYYWKHFFTIFEILRYSFKIRKKSNFKMADFPSCNFF